MPKITRLGLALVAALLLLPAAVASAGETDTRPSDQPASDQPANSDQPTDQRESDESDHRVTDRPVTDRPVTDETDRPVTDRFEPVRDRPVDRPICDRDDRRPECCRKLHDTDVDVRCDRLTDHQPNYRHLIHRLVAAHEWEKLVRLLNALGII